MKALRIALLTVAMVSMAACASFKQNFRGDPVSRAEDDATYVKNFCTALGFGPGSPEFPNCVSIAMTRRESQRQADQATDRRRESQSDYQNELRRTPGNDVACANAVARGNQGEIMTMCD